MNQDSSFHDAKRLYLESYGDPMVTNTYLKIALVLVSLIAVALVLVDLRTIRTFENFRPLVIRIDDLGRAEAINYHHFEYKPQDAEAATATPSRMILQSRCTSLTESWRTESWMPTARMISSANSLRMRLRPRSTSM